MFRDRGLRFMRIGRWMSLAIVVFGALAATSSAAVAMTGEYAAFRECPIGTSELQGCFVLRTESGNITIGKATVPILSTLTIQGGFGEANEQTGAAPFVGASNGETVSRTPQSVPGGLFGPQRFSRGFFGALNGVSAVIELAAPASSIYFNEAVLFFQAPFPPYPPALALPVKIKLENPLLGNDCYIGSETEPIALSLTTGATDPPPPNTPIAGSLGKKASRGAGRILVVPNSSLVGNAWSAPKATGCGAFGLLDGLIDNKVGLPSPAGANTAILDGTIEQAGIGAVELSGEAEVQQAHTGHERTHGQEWTPGQERTPGQEWIPPPGNHNWHH
jgi:hypothetical protein